MTIGGLAVVAAGLLVVLAPLFVGFFRGGAFDAEDERRTLLVLGAFALSVPFDALQYPLARALYATRNTSLQVLASLAASCRREPRCRAVGPLGIRGHPAGVRRGYRDQVRADGDRRSRRASDASCPRRSTAERQPTVSGFALPTETVGTTAMKFPSRPGYAPSGRCQGR